MRAPITPIKIKNTIIKILKDNKATDLLALNIKKLTTIADYMVIGTANSTTHAKTLTEKICTHLAQEAIKPLGIEGEESREWMLADFGSVIVHIMLEPIRNYYELEKLWGFNTKLIAPPNRIAEKS